MSNVENANTGVNNLTRIYIQQIKADKQIQTEP